MGRSRNRIPHSFLFEIVSLSIKNFRLPFSDFVIVATSSSSFNCDRRFYFVFSAILSIFSAIMFRILNVSISIVSVILFYERCSWWLIDVLGNYVLFLVIVLCSKVRDFLDCGFIVSGFISVWGFMWYDYYSSKFKIYKIISLKKHICCTWFILLFSIKV